MPTYSEPIPWIHVVNNNTESQNATQTIQYGKFPRLIKLNEDNRCTSTHTVNQQTAQQPKTMPIAKRCNAVVNPEIFEINGIVLAFLCAGFVSWMSRGVGATILLHQKVWPSGNASQPAARRKSARSAARRLRSPSITAPPEWFHDRNALVAARRPPLLSMRRSVKAERLGLHIRRSGSSF